MCGIFGIIKNDKHDLNVLNTICDVLNLLKNRGYDGCGMMLNEGNNVVYNKYGIDDNEEDIFKLLEQSFDKNKNYTVGMGHTRWATHGIKINKNSHPHASLNNKIFIIHNGIISNCTDLKKKYLNDYPLQSDTDTEIIVALLYTFKNNWPEKSFLEILKLTVSLLVGSWACIIYNIEEQNKLYFIKNRTPLLISKNKDISMFASETSGFLNLTDEYILLRDFTIGYVLNDELYIEGDYKVLPLCKNKMDDIQLDKNYSHWMRKEIDEQIYLNVLYDPITNMLRYKNDTVLFDMDFIKDCKYLYIIGCGSSYYAGAIASNYFRFTKAFEFVNVIEAGEFTKTHLESVKDPEKNLLIMIISQSGETSDLNNCIQICREFSSNRKNMLKYNLEDPKEYLLNEKINNYTNDFDEIKIIGIINVIDSLLSRRTIKNIYTNVGRENAVASTKSNTAQIIACLLLSIYKAQLSDTLEISLKNKFFNDLQKLTIDIQDTIHLETQIMKVSKSINEILEKNNSNSLFLLGVHELKHACDEGSLKLKEISYIHAESFHLLNLKHGPFALLKKNAIVIISYKTKTHNIISAIEEVKSRGGIIFEIAQTFEQDDNIINIPQNKTFTGLLVVIIFQLMAYHIGVLRKNNVDFPKNLCKCATVD